MADSKLSDLTAASALTGTELFYSDDGTADVKVTATQIKTLAVGAGSVSVATGKTLTASNTLTLSGTDSTTMTFPSTSTTVAGLGVANTFTANQTISGASLIMSGNISSAAWTTNGLRYKSVAATLTDTSSSGTVAAAYTNVYGGNTIAASNTTTFTDYFTTYINQPTAGTNVTFTNRWALGVGGNVKVTGSLALGASGKTIAVDNSLTLAGTDGTTMTFPPASASVGYLNIPQNSQTANYTTVLADSGKHIIMNGSSLTFTVDSNANVAFTVGTVITVVNANSTSLSIAITSDTLTFAGTTTTGSRTLNQNGIATLIKVGTTSWLITGTGLA